MWVNVSIRTRAELAEALSEALLERGALSVSVEDADAGTERETPQFGEPGSPATPLWANSKIVALFEPAPDLIGIVAAAAQQVGLADLPDIELEDVAEENWVQLTQAQFEPIKIDERLWIVPSWHMEKFAAPAITAERSEQTLSPPSAGQRRGLSEQGSEPPERASCAKRALRGAGGRFIDGPSGSSCILQLDPGMAFGTGSHPTTHLCLEWLLNTVQPGDTLLDYGCGSGILAIAGAKLGASRIVGVEIDEQAIAAAHANAVQNAVMIDLRHSSMALPETFDLVVANILTNPLCVMAPLLASRVASSGGRLALSGVLESQAQQVIDAYAPYIQLKVGAVKEGWCRLEGRSD